MTASARPRKPEPARIGTADGVAVLGGGLRASSHDGNLGAQAGAARIRARRSPAGALA